MSELLSGSQATAAVPVVAFKKRGARARGNIRQKAATPASSGSDSASDGSSDEDAPQGPRIKRRRKDAATSVNATSVAPAVATTGPARAELLPTTFKADRSVPITHTDDATKRSNWYDEESKIGPRQSSTNVRRITVIDFAPDVCKDYKKTGFCGFGDNCKFLHDRSDFKQGWELDRDWEKVTKGTKNLGGTVVASAAGRGRAEERSREDDDDDDEEALLRSIPFACIICEGPYKAPVVTQCGHYFCEPCALKRYRKDPTCAVCRSGTNGVFNSATKLKKLLERKTEREAMKRQAAGGSSDDDEDDDEDDE